jgi:GNAT superfamily N-acetyltransferase
MGTYLEPFEVEALFEPYRDEVAACIPSDPKDLKISSEFILGEIPSMWLTLNLNDQEVARGLIQQMPGCCGLCISTAASVHPSYRGKGIGTLMNEFRIDVARYADYGAMICTDVLHNDAQQKILTKNGWSNIFEFDNPRTGNAIGIHIIDVKA